MFFFAGTTGIPAVRFFYLHKREEPNVNQRFMRGKTDTAAAALNGAADGGFHAGELAV